MGKDIFYLRDQFDVAFSDIIQIRDQFDGAIKDSTEDKKYLELEIDATHGGYKNKNSYYYTTEGQAKGVGSWITPYGKPVISEHNQGTKPVGRITAAAFIPLAVKDTQKDNLKVPKSKIRLKALIVDQDAIQCILDKRYFTVSTGARPVDTPKCSVCNAACDVVGGVGFVMTCKHTKGKTYEGKDCYIIFGQVEYQECSFVNMPADYTPEHVASVIGYRFVNESDAMGAGPNITFSSSDSATTVVDNVIENVDDNKNTDKEIGGTTMADTTKTQEPLPAKEVIADSDIQAYIDEAFTVLDECAACNDGDDVENVWLEKDLAEVAALDAEFAKAVEMLIGDKVLTTEEKKGMKSGTFCGPNKTFPIPDCKHAATAMAMLNFPGVVKKYSPASRSKIASCVRGKAKTLGCPMSKKAKDSEKVEQPDDSIELNWTDAQKDEILAMDNDFADVMEAIIGDKVLPKVGTEGREKMTTHFCGPNKTFPIPDCKHASVASAMLNWPRVKSKYSSEARSRISGCVHSRAKALGCSSAKGKDSVPASVVDSEKLTAEITKLNTILQEKDSLLKAAEDKLLVLQKDNKERLAEKVIDLSIIAKHASVQNVLSAKTKEDRDKAYSALKDNLVSKENTSLTDSIKDLSNTLSFNITDSIVSEPGLSVNSNNKKSGPDKVEPVKKDGNWLAGKLGISKKQ